MLSIFPFLSWLSTYLLCKNVFSFLLAMFYLDYFFFGYWYYNMSLYFCDCFLHCAEAFYFDEVPIVYRGFCFPCLRRHIQKECMEYIWCQRDEGSFTNSEGLQGHKISILSWFSATLAQMHLSTSTPARPLRSYFSQLQHGTLPNTLSLE